MTGWRREALNAYAPGFPDTHILSAVDRDALFAAYGRFEPGALPEDMTAEGLGPWADTSFHVRGELGIAGAAAGVSFGVSLRNGLAQPWASGPAPGVGLADNRALAGTATWSGALLGISRPLGETVAGDLEYTVRVSGNGFVRTGGDAGEVKGAFVGHGHEGMVGVLERADLAAGFGGKR